MKAIIQLIYRQLVMTDTKLDQILSQQKETHDMLARYFQDQAKRQDDDARFRAGTNERIKALEDARRG